LETAFIQVREALRRLDDLQASHLDSFETQTLPDLEDQMAQRKAGFSHLKKQLTPFFLEAKAMDRAEKAPMIADVKMYFQSLLHQNERLKIKIESHKNRLENSIKNITKGRQVFRAYRSPAAQRNQPKVINTRK
jgi:hypothetical protein